MYSTCLPRWHIFDIYICHVNAGPSRTLAASDEKFQSARNQQRCEQTLLAKMWSIFDSWFGFMFLLSLGPFDEFFWHFSTSFNRTSESELFHICPSHVPLCFVCFGRSITWASLMDGHNGIGISGSNGIVFGRFFRSLNLWRSQEGWPAVSKGSNIWCLLYQRLTVHILFSLNRHLFCRKATN